MTEKKFKYERPYIVDLSLENAEGAVCTNGDITTGDSGGCSDGSCVANSRCNSGIAAMLCVNGSNAGGKGFCVGCCTTGTGNAGPYACWCSPGNTAGWQCLTNGSRAYLGTCDSGTGDAYC